MPIWHDGPVTFFLLFAAVIVAGAVAVLAAGPRRAGGEPGPASRSRALRRDAVPALAEPDPRLPAVLLPEHPQAADVADLRFSVAFRGYRMDQVDEVLTRLAAALAERDELITRLGGNPGTRFDRHGTGRPLPGGQEQG